MANTAGGSTNETSSASGTERLAALATPLRKKVAVPRVHGSQVAVTPRQAAISARKQVGEQKRREAMVLKQQREEMKSAAKSKQAAVFVEQQQSIKARAEKAQRQRKNTAAAKKIAMEKDTVAKAKELQANMEECRHLKECLRKGEKERMRNSIAHKNAEWSKERSLKQRQEQARQAEQRMIMEERKIFLEAKERVKEERKLIAKGELMWRVNALTSEKTRQKRQGAKAAKEALELRTVRALNQAALENAAKEEKRLRRQSAQWRKNEKMLDVEIKRSTEKKALDAKKLANEVLLRYRDDNEDRKAREIELSKARKAENELKRLQHANNRLYKQEEEMKRKEQEARERRVLLEDRESMIENIRKEKEDELDRRERLREPPSYKTKLEILEEIWAKQTHPAARAAIQGRRRLCLQEIEELASLEVDASPEINVSPEANASPEATASRDSGEADGFSNVSETHDSGFAVRALVFPATPSPAGSDVGEDGQNDLDVGDGGGWQQPRRGCAVKLEDDSSKLGTEVMTPLLGAKEGSSFPVSHTPEGSDIGLEGGEGFVGENEAR